MRAGGYYDESTGPAGEHKRGTESSPAVKQFIVRLKAIMRPGAMEDPASRFHIMALLDQLRPDEFGDTLIEAEKLKNPQSGMVNMILMKWAANNGPAAMKYAVEHSKDVGIAGMDMKKSVAFAWAASDPDAVWQWYNDNKDKDSGGFLEGNHVILGSVFTNLLSTNPDAAFKRLDELDPESRHLALMGMCISSGRMDDDKRQLLLDKINTMTDEKEKASSRHLVVNWWTTSSPDDAIAWVAKQPAEDQKSLRSGVGSSLMLSDPNKGAAYIMEGASEAEIPDRRFDVVFSWSMSDPKAAAAWFDSQGNGAELDGERQTMVTKLSGNLPEAAMIEAQSITDPNKRLSAISMAYGVWIKKEPSAAEQALQNAGLTAEQVQSIRSSQQKGSP